MGLLWKMGSEKTSRFSEGMPSPLNPNHRLQVMGDHSFTYDGRITTSHNLRHGNLILVKRTPASKTRHHNLTQSLSNETQ